MFGDLDVYGLIVLSWPFLRHRLNVCVSLAAIYTVCAEHGTLIFNNCFVIQPRT